VHVPTSHAASMAPEISWDPESFLVECTAFPNGQRDDQVDACFVADTLVFTQAGPVSIADICVGDIVLGQCGWMAVQRAWQTGVREVIERYGCGPRSAGWGGSRPVLPRERTEPVGRAVQKPTARGHAGS